MPPDNELVTTGTVLQRGNGASPEVFTAIGGVFDIKPSQPVRAKIPIADLTDTAKRFKPGILESGELVVQYNLLPADPAQAGLDTDFAAGTLRNFKLVYPKAVGSGTDTFAAFVSGLSRATMGVNGLQMRTATLQISGAITAT